MTRSLGLIATVVPFAVFANCSGKQPPSTSVPAFETAADETSRLVDDFEDGDLLSELGVSWLIESDKYMGGSSELTINEKSPGAGSQVGLHFSYALSKGHSSVNPCVMMSLPLKNATNLSLTAFKGIKYTYKGAAHIIQIETANINDYDVYGAPLPASEKWQTVELPWHFFEQRGFGKAVPFKLEEAEKLLFRVDGQDGEHGTLALDDIAFMSQDASDGNPLNLARCEYASIVHKDISMIAYFYFPKDNGPNPVLIVLPGGTVYSVGKIWPHYKSFGRHMAARGYTVVVLDYASPNRNFFDPKQTDDINAAIDTIKKRPDISNSDLFVVGFSVGGSNGLRVAASRTDLSGLITYFAPTDWSDTDVETPIEKQPVAFCEEIAAPVLIIQGAEDVITPPEEAELLYKRLTELGKPSELIMYKDAVHGFTYEGAPVKNIVYDEKISQESFEAVDAFVKKHLKKRVTE